MKKLVCNNRSTAPLLASSSMDSFSGLELSKSILLETRRKNGWGIVFAIQTHRERKKKKKKKNLYLLQEPGLQFPCELTHRAFSEKTDQLRRAARVTEEGIHSHQTSRSEDSVINELQ